MRPLFYGGKEKAFTFSYDDGVTQDRQMVEIFNKYNMKCTFNLNSGTFGMENVAIGYDHFVSHYKIKPEEVADLYKGHEVAAHSVTHPRLQFLSEDTMRYEIMEDRMNLEDLVGYPVNGFAYPYGTYDDTVIRVLEESGIKYARTVEETGEFGIPQNFLKWHPTCHFHSDKLDDCTERFLTLGTGTILPKLLPVFYVWGHSYELDAHNAWDKMEDFCKKVSGQEDVWYATNGEIVEYYEALSQAVYFADGTGVKNNSSLSLWFDVDGAVVEVKPGEVYRA